jgi:hypothetical protein
MEIARLWGRPWDDLVAEYGEAALFGWYRVHLDPTGERPSAPAPQGQRAPRARRSGR